MSELLRETIDAAERLVAGEDSRVGDYLERLLNSPGELQSGEDSERVYLAALLDFIGLSVESVRVLRAAPSAMSRNMEGMLATAHGQHAQARNLLVEALHSAADSTPLRQQILANLAAVSLRAGSVEEAETWIEAAATGQAGGLAVDALIATVLATIAASRGDLPTLRSAAASLEEASKLRLAELGLQDPQALAIVANMASVEIMVARTENSAVRLERAIDVLEVAAVRLAAEFGADHPQAKGAMASLTAARGVLTEPPVTSAPLAPVAFAALLRKLRTAALISQPRLAELSGTSLTAIREIERGVARPRHETVQRLADALGLVGSARTDFETAAQGRLVFATGRQQESEQAVDFHRDLGDRFGQASALLQLGDARRLTGDFPAGALAVEQALWIYRELGNQLGQANALNMLGVMRGAMADYRASAQALEQALSIYRDLGDRRGQASALLRLGNVRQLTGDYRIAVQEVEQALGIYRDLGDRLGQANALNMLGVMQGEMADHWASALVLEEALGIYRDLGNLFGQASALFYLGHVRRRVGDYRIAVRELEQALSIYRDLGDLFGQASALGDLGGALRLSGDYRASAQALEQALGIYRDLGSLSGEAEVLNEIGMLHRVGGELSQAEGSHQQALNLARRLASPWDEANALAGLGRCALAIGQAPRAKALLRQALAIFERINANEASDLLAELDSLTSPPPAE